MELYGWDTAYALEIGEVNRALEARKDQLIVDFSVDGPDPLPIKAKGKFADWRIVEGGSGQIIFFKLTVGEGQAEIDFNGAKKVDLAGTSMTVAVQLRLLPTSPQEQQLKFNIDKVGEEGEPTLLGMITPIRIEVPGGQIDIAKKALLQTALLAFIVNNASKITYVFASINLVAPTTNSWLTPVRSAYAYADRNGGTGVLSILSVTTDRPIFALPRQVDPLLLSLQYSAALGVSPRLFMENVLLPALPQVFGNGATAGSFALSGGGAIVNTVAIDMGGFEVGGIVYHPMVDNLSINTSGSGLFSEYRGNCDLKAGITMNFSVCTDNRVFFNPQTKGIGFQPDPNPVTNHEAHIPSRGIMEVVVNAIANGIASSLTRDAGEKITIVRNPPLSIKWAETSALDVQDAGVNRSFYMRGALTHKQMRGEAALSSNCQANNLE